MYNNRNWNSAVSFMQKKIVGFAGLTAVAVKQVISLWSDGS